MRLMSIIISSFLLLLFSLFFSRQFQYSCWLPSCRYVYHTMLNILFFILCCKMPAFLIFFFFFDMLFDRLMLLLLLLTTSLHVFHICR